MTPFCFQFHLTFAFVFPPVRMYECKYKGKEMENFTLLALAVHLHYGSSQVCCLGLHLCHLCESALISIFMQMQFSSITSLPPPPCPPLPPLSPRLTMLLTFTSSLRINSKEKKLTFLSPSENA